MTYDYQLHCEKMGITVYAKKKASSIPVYIHLVSQGALLSAYTHRKFFNFHNVALIYCLDW